MVTQLLFSRFRIYQHPKKCDYWNATCTKPFFLYFIFPLITRRKWYNNSVLFLNLSLCSFFPSFFPITASFIRLHCKSSPFSAFACLTQCCIDWRRNLLQLGVFIYMCTPKLSCKMGWCLFFRCYFLRPCIQSGSFQVTYLLFLSFCFLSFVLSLFIHYWFLIFFSSWIWVITFLQVFHLFLLLSDYAFIASFVFGLCLLFF